MKPKYLTIIILALIAAAVVSVYFIVNQPQDLGPIVVNHNTMPASKPLTPEKATKDFYDRYITDVINYIDKKSGQNPLTEKYMVSLPLTASLQNVALTQIQYNSESDSGRDPFLCAQDVPDSGDSLSVRQLSQNQTSAAVQITNNFFGPQPLVYNVSLVMQNGQWLIDSVDCAK